jgi:uncharacterized membrane protein YdjX (TVP38/TMEM64 family)
MGSRPREDVLRGALVVGVLLLLALGARALRQALGITWSPESVRTAIEGLGVWGPVILVLLLSVRTFVLIPSQVLLVAGGLCFGTWGGTLYGALGVTGSGLLLFGLTRWAGREALLQRVPPRMRVLLDTTGARMGAAVVLLGTGYPVGPINAYPVGAALTGLRLPLFGLALGGGSVLRALTYAWFGSRLVDGGWLDLVLAACALTAAILVPLLVPRVRRRVWSELRGEALSQPGGDSGR